MSPIHTTECYSAMVMKKTLLSGTARRDLESIVFSERNPTQKDKLQDSAERVHAQARLRDSEAAGDGDGAGLANQQVYSASHTQCVHSRGLPHSIMPTGNGTILCT